MQKAWI